MTLPEVRAILGKPFDDSLLDPEGPPNIDASDARLLWGEMPERGTIRLWISESVVMWIAFGDDNRVKAAWMDSDPKPPRSWLPGRVWRRLRARYGW